MSHNDSNNMGRAYFISKDFTGALNVNDNIRSQVKNISEFRNQLVIKFSILFNGTEFGNNNFRRILLLNGNNRGAARGAALGSASGAVFMSSLEDPRGHSEGLSRDSYGGGSCS